MGACRLAGLCTRRYLERSPKPSSPCPAFLSSQSARQRGGGNYAGLRLNPQDMPAQALRAATSLPQSWPLASGERRSSQLPMTLDATTT